MEKALPITREQAVFLRDLQAEATAAQHALNIALRAVVAGHGYGPGVRCTGVSVEQNTLTIVEPERG